MVLESSDQVLGLGFRDLGLYYEAGLDFAVAGSIVVAFSPTQAWHD
jgi:hypothetical protein